MDDRLTAALCALRLSRLGDALAAAGLGELAACEHALLESRTAFLSTLRSAGIGTLPERQVRLPPWGGSRTPNRTSAARAGSTADRASGKCTSRCSRAPTTLRRGLHPVSAGHTLRVHSALPISPGAGARQRPAEAAARGRRACLAAAGRRPALPLAVELAPGAGPRNLRGSRGLRPLPLEGSARCALLYY